MLRPHEEKYIPSIAFEENLVGAYESYVGILRELGVPTPVAVCLSLLEVKGYRMGVSNEYYPFSEELGPIDRNDLLLPDAVVEDLSLDAGTVLRPLFDLIWNAAGWERSLNYDENGRWRARR